jgi:hypothetical protein
MDQLELRAGATQSHRLQKKYEPLEEATTSTGQCPWYRPQRCVAKRSCCSSSGLGGNFSCMAHNLCRLTRSMLLGYAKVFWTFRITQQIRAAPQAPPFCQFSSPSNSLAKGSIKNPQQPKSGSRHRRSTSCRKISGGNLIPKYA